MKSGFIRPAVIVSAIGLLLGGCNRSDNPISPSGSMPVSLSVGFSGSGGLTLAKVGGISDVDSIRIDSAVVVLARIKFESHIDSVSVDTTGEGEDDGDEGELNVVFRGPFVVHIRDVIAVDFATQVLPAGSYNGIKFKIHRLQPGEHHEDSDEHNGHPGWGSLPYGSSIVVWGVVLRDGVWEPFTFEFDGEFEFKLKGDFVVPEATSVVNIALNFDLGLWFRNPETGGLLDPTDTSITSRQLFRRAIRHAFEIGCGGHDDDDDGEPDDDEGDDD